VTVLLDTGFILAALIQRERRHRWARSTLADILAGRYGAPYVTDYIVDEALNYASARLSPRDAEKLLHFLLERDAVRILPVSIDVFTRAVEVYRQHLPRLSFTDATTLVTARLYKIDYIATLDKYLAHQHPSIAPP